MTLGELIKRLEALPQDMILQHGFSHPHSYRGYYVEGSTISIDLFCEEFFKTLDAMQVSKWSKIKVGKDMPRDKFPKGRRRDGKWYYGNISFINGEAIGQRITKDPSSDYLVGVI